MGGKSGGGGDIDIDPAKVFPGLITPSFSLLPQSLTVAPTSTGATGGGALSRTRRTSGRPGRLGPRLGASRAGQQIRASQGISGPLANTAFGGGGGFFGGAGGGGGGSGNPFVLSRTGPFDPFAAEEAVLQGLQSNRAAVAGLLPGIQGLRGPLGAIRGQTAGLRGELTELGEEVRPGFGRLTTSQVAALRDREAQEHGNLRESLRNRRVLGSSFGIREQQRLERGFGQEEERLRSEAFVQEIGLRREVLGDIGRLIQVDQQTLALELGISDAEAANLQQQFQTVLAEGQLASQRASRELAELQVSGNIINQVTASATNLAGIQAQADASSAAGFGELFGSIAGAFIGLNPFGFGV